MALPAGPTLNPEYNGLLLKWGPNAKPACEECAADLTDKHVHDLGHMWVGDCCLDNDAVVCDPREDFHSDG